MLNRSFAPSINGIGDITLEKPEEIIFSNGLKVFVFHAPDQELVKAEFVFNNLFEGFENPVRNTALSSMLKEGTTSYTSAQIAEKIDFFGAYLVPEFSFDHNALTLYALNKHIDAVLPIVNDILNHSIIPEQELETYIRNNSQSLQISLEKTDFIARRKFYDSLFGSTRYGQSVTDELLKGLERDDLLRLYKQQIQPKNATLFLSGNISKEVLFSFRNYFEEQWKGEVAIQSVPYIQKLDLDTDLVKIDKAGALQSSIRLGKVGIKRSHADYPALQFVNTLFGGFFGSRLMSNIREDKGYTYSIGSLVANLNHAGFISVVTDVGSEYTDDTLKQIELESRKLQEEKVSEEELELVKNYMLGSMLGSLESIFSHVDKFKSVYYSGLDLDYYTYYSNVVRQINPDQVQDIAQKYLGVDDMVKVVVG
ncbi:M16 family metallopeptidase [Sphingobacterium cellulitidis]|uniref:Peptidase M16 n=1 Tax=Sphingobacterium cellulitidis TaxID=1768011 RepID=A0A8H9G369_9SPHI|nr:pitrilysin family protein [Sphingobacterium soli]MBA8985991.1 putative Zn-dependent peptidase [Sphingobacterium soli]GGE28069.1 peptidase M16 [Sphingobacterium soli]